MAEIITFPQRPTGWELIRGNIEENLVVKGATADEIAVLIPRLRAIWELMTASWSLEVPFTVPGPLTDEQRNAIKEHAAECVRQGERSVIPNNAKILFHIAGLELDLLRLRGPD